jgi:transposase
MKKEVSLQSVGIDIAKDKFDVCFKEKYQDGSDSTKGSTTFINDTKGFGLFYEWCLKRHKPDVELLFVMEATGVYYEDLCYFLNSKNQKVSVQLPQKVKFYTKSLNVKTKNDKVDASVIASMALDRSISILGLWTPPSKFFKGIRDLTRTLNSLKKSKTAVSSQLHALEHAHECSENALMITKKQIEFYDTTIEETESILLKLAKEDSELYQKIQRIQKVKGLGFITIIKIIAETNGFALFTNIRQLVSYAGLDVVDNQSGNIKKRNRISKKGNSHIREALYMPAMSSARYNETMKAHYEQLNQRMVCKRQGLISVMRKMLILIYSLWKSNEEYVVNHEEHKTVKKTKPSLAIEVGIV